MAWRDIERADELIHEILQLLDERLQLSQTIGSQTRDGYFSIAQARKSMGLGSVTSMQYPTKMFATTAIEISYLKQEFEAKKGIKPTEEQDSDDEVEEQEYDDIPPQETKPNSSALSSSSSPIDAQKEIPSEKIQPRKKFGVIGNREGIVMVEEYFPEPSSSSSSLSSAAPQPNEDYQDQPSKPKKLDDLSDFLARMNLQVPAKSEQEQPQVTQEKAEQKKSVAPPTVEKSEEKPKQIQKSKFLLDPLRWFGVLSSPHLRSAQSQFNSALDNIIAMATIQRKIDLALIELEKQRIIIEDEKS